MPTTRTYPLMLGQLEAMIALLKHERPDIDASTPILIDSFASAETACEEWDEYRPTQQLIIEQVSVDDPATLTECTRTCIIISDQLPNTPRYTDDHIPF